MLLPYKGVETKINVMKLSSEPKIIPAIEVNEDFNWGATITVLLLLLCFVGASFYVLVSSFLDI